MRVFHQQNGKKPRVGLRTRRGGRGRTDSTVIQTDTALGNSTSRYYPANILAHVQSVIHNTQGYLMRLSFQLLVIVTALDPAAAVTSPHHGRGLKQHRLLPPSSEGRRQRRVPPGGSVEGSTSELLPASRGFAPSSVPELTLPQPPLPLASAS